VKEKAKLIEATRTLARSHTLTFIYNYVTWYFCFSEDCSSLRTYTGMLTKN